MKVLHVDHSGTSIPKILNVKRVSVDSQAIDETRSYGYLTLWYEGGYDFATHIWPVDSAPDKYKEGQNLEGIAFVAMCPDNF